MKSKRLRWKKEPKEAGLRAVGSGPRRSTLTNGEETFADVYCLWRDGFPRGWCWVCFSPRLTYVNTYRKPVCTEDEAKAQAMTYVKDGLERSA